MFKSIFFRKKNISIYSKEGNNSSSLQRVLSVKDLTFFGIAAIMGAGSFSSIGFACYSGGPAVVFLFIICAVACGFTALCYAEFAARVPGAGSAYSYAYVSFGEIIAWIIGWALVMEYSIGNIYVAFSWSSYFVNLIEGIGIHIPNWLTNNYTDAHHAFINQSNNSLSQSLVNAPSIGGLKIIFDLPATVINILITILIFKSTTSTRNASNVIVIIKLLIVFLVLIVGAFYIDIDNWTPFMPNHFNGVMAGVSGVFFAFIGFDAVSTLAEESKNPQKDLPKGMIYSLIVCTIVFVLLVLVLTGIMPYYKFTGSDPLADIFAYKGVKWMLYIVSVAAVIAMTSVMIVFQMGQPRIWMAMSRDGLLPNKFSKVHSKYKTPSYATIVTGFMVGVPIFFTTPQMVLDFTSIGTLFAFIIVCAAVLVLPKNNNQNQIFKLPYINSKLILPIITIISFCFIITFVPFSIYLEDNIHLNFMMIGFYILWLTISVLAYFKNFSLIPVLGVLSCSYLLTGVNQTNWVMFLIWLVIGLVIYFMYSFKKSKLNKNYEK